MSARYRAIYRNGKLFAEYEGDELIYLSPDYEPPARSDHPAPHIVSDYHPPFKSMADGRMYDSKSAYRRTLKERDRPLTEVGNDFHFGKPFGAKTKSEERRRLLHKQLADVSDREANKVLKQLKKAYLP